jgi:beta-N-acetylhexosaminidase
MSPRIMGDLLRGEFQFSGVAVSDALEMGGIARYFSPEEAIVRAFNAGCDQLIMPADNGHAVRALVDAVRQKQVSEKRLDEAVARILEMKQRHGLFSRDPAVPEDLIARLNTQEHRQVALQSALAGVTLVHDRENRLPISASSRLAVISFSNHDHGRYTDPKMFGAFMEPFVSSEQSVDCETLQDPELIKRAMELGGEADMVVLAAFTKVVISAGTMDLHSRYVDFVSALSSCGKPLVMISFGNPYIIKQFPGVDTYVCAYGSSEATQEATAMLLAGKTPFRGILPITITTSDGKT